MRVTFAHPSQQELETQSSNTDEDFFLEREEIVEESMNMSPGQSHALFMKTFAMVLKDIGLRSPQYYEDKSQCVSFADIRPVERACLKAFRLKSGFVEPEDLIKRLQQLKPSENFELREFKHPHMSWIKPPVYRKDECPPDLKEDSPIWVFEMYCRLSRLLGDRRAKPFFAWLEEHWKKIELSLNRASLPDLHLLKNNGSSPNGTLYPRYLVQGLLSLRACVEEKVSYTYEKKVMKADKKRKAAVLDWEERHPDIKLNHDLTCMYRTWPSDLMDELDEIDRQTAWSQRRIYIDLLVKAEKQMQELVNFWKDCKLITGQRTPPSPDIQSPDSSPEKSPQIGRESGENQSPSGFLGSPQTQAESSQLQAKASGPVHTLRKKIKLSEPQENWNGRLRPRTKTAKASCQTSRTDRHKPVHKSSTKINMSEPRNIWDGRLRSSARNT